MNREKLGEVISWAGIVAATGPARRDPYALSATVSWNGLAHLRDALDELGYDWRAVRKSLGRPPVKEARK